MLRLGIVLQSAILLAALALSACATGGGSQVLRVLGEGSAAPSAQETLRRPSPAGRKAADAPVAWSDRTIQGEGAVAVAPGPRDAGIVLLARRQAYDLAMHALAEEVMALPAGPKDRTVADALRNHPERAQALEGVVRRDAQEMSAGIAPGDGYVVRLSLPLAGVAEALAGVVESKTSDRLLGLAEPPEPTRPAQAPRDEKEARELSYRAAIGDARGRLLEAVRQVQVEPGRSVGDLMDENVEAAGFVLDRVGSARVRNRVHPQPVDCRVVVEFDAGRLVRRLRSRFNLDNTNAQGQ